MDGGIPKNLEVGGIYDFFVILGCRGLGKVLGFFHFLGPSSCILNLSRSLYCNSVEVSKFYIVSLNRNIQSIFSCALECK